MENQNCQTTENVEETIKLAEELARYLKQFDIIFLQGELGSGKTTFVKGLVAGLGGDPVQVTSPSYTLINRYDDTDPIVIHADLYRLNSIDDQETVGLEDYFFRGLVVVEWAEKWELGWAGNSLQIKLEHMGRNQRKITIKENRSDDLNG